MFTKRLFLMLLALSGLAMPGLRAQGEARLTIEECQELAQRNYPLTQRYDLIRKTSEFTLENILKDRLPRINVSAQATYQSDVPSFPDALSDVLKQNGLKMKGISPLQYRAVVDVQHNVYDGGRIASRLETTKAENEVELAANDVALYQLCERICNLCFALLAIDERLKLNQELRIRLSSNCQKVQALFDGGVASRCDTEAMQAELAQAEQQATELHAQRNQVVRVLRLFVAPGARGNEEKFSIVRPTERAVKAFTAMGDNGATESNHPELQLYEKQLQLADTRERGLDINLRPQVGLFAQGFYGYTGYDMFRDMRERTPSLGAVVGVRVSWNLSNLYTRKNDRGLINLQRQRILNDRDRFLFNQRVQTTQEDADIERFRRLIADDERILSLRRDVRVMTEAKLDGGIIDVNALVQELTREHQAAINKSSHEVELLHHIYLKEIYR